METGVGLGVGNGTGVGCRLKTDVTAVITDEGVAVEGLEHDTIKAQIRIVRYFIKYVKGEGKCM